MKKIAPLVLVLALGLCPLSAGAATLNLYDSFPDHQGDNNLYAYTYYGTSYTLLNENISGLPNQTDQQKYFFYYTTGGSLPYVYKSITYGGSGSPWIGLEPGYPSIGGNYTELDAVLAWKVPTTGTYRLQGTFWDALNNPHPENFPIKVYVRENSTTLWDNNGDPLIGGTTYLGGTPVNFDLTLALTAGDFIYFGVNPDGTNTADIGRFTGTITPIPLPPSAFLLATGLLCLGLAARGRRRFLQKKGE